MEKKFRKTFEKMEGLSFVTPVHVSIDLILERKMIYYLSPLLCIVIG
jgi:hypothetical protein